MSNISEPKPLTSVGDNLNKVVLQLLNGEPKGLILDSPAGEGALTQELKTKGFEVYACDIDPSQFKVSGVSIKKADLNKELPYENSIFDYIISIEGLEHLEDPWQCIREFSRVLKRSGKLIVTTPNVSSLYSRMLFLTRGNFYLFDDHALDYGHINPLIYKEIELILTKNGFEIEKVTNEYEVIENNVGNKLFYSYLCFLADLLNFCLYSVYFIHRHFNTYICGSNKELSSFLKASFLSNKKISEGSILIIKARKK